MKEDIRRGVLFVVALSAFMAWLEYRGAFAGLEGKSQDIFWLQHGRPAIASDIIILQIDDEAYAQFFKSTSPMSPVVLTNLVRQIASVQPEVVGVDVLTTSEAEGGDTYRRFAREQLGSKTVWISGAEKFHLQQAKFYQWIAGIDDELVVKPTQVLGYGLKQLDLHHEILWGPAVNPTEQDLKLRRFPRELKISENAASVEGAKSINSWARVVAQQYCATNAGKCKQLEGKEDVYLSVAGPPPPRLKLTEFFACSGKYVTFKPGQHEVLKQLARGKIVLLGGTFASSGDFHNTTEGFVPGIIFNARAIAAEIHGVAYHDIPQPYSFFLDIFFGIIVVLIFAGLKKWFKREAHTARTMMIGSAIVAVVTMAILYFSGYMFSVAAVVIAATIQQFYDFWRENPKIVESSE